MGNSVVSGDTVYQIHQKDRHIDRYKLQKFKDNYGYEDLIIIKSGNIHVTGINIWKINLHNDYKFNKKRPISKCDAIEITQGEKRI